MKLFFLFLDGIGLGNNDAQINPLARAEMPNLRALLDGKGLVAGEHLPLHNGRASLLALDACLGMEGLPQSATGQASLLTGRNVPAALGYHDGPKPNPQVAELLKNGSLFSRLHALGKKTGLLNAYPPRYFAALDSGHRLPGAIAMAARHAGIPLKTQDDLFAGEALSADFTAEGWRDHLGIAGTPLLSPSEAGERLANLAGQYDFAIFEYWLSDVVGHRQNISEACSLLESLDQVLGGLLAAWDEGQGLILLTSDHGNLEDLSTRHHTLNPVPCLLVGNRLNRGTFIECLYRRAAGALPDLTSIAPSILSLVA